MPTSSDPAGRAVRRLAVLLAGSVALAGCSDGGPTGDGGDGDGNGGAQRTISVLGFAPEPTRLIVRSGALYWLDASDEPLNRLSLADDVHTPLVATLPIPEYALSDGQSVFWISGGRLYRTTLDGTATTLLDQGERDPASAVTAAIVLDATHVYWANSVSSPSCSPACTFTIKRLPKSGGTAQTLTATSQAIVALAIADAHVFWEEVGVGPVSEDGSAGSAIKKISIAGGSVTVLVNGLLNGLIPPPSPGFMPASWHPTGGIETDGSSVYFADADFFDSYRVMSVPAAGGDVAVLAEITTGDASNFARGLELDATNLYWVDASSLKFLPRAGGSHSDLVGPLPSPVSLVLAVGNLFWLETTCCAHGQTGTIWRIPTTGGAPVLVRSEIDAPVSISADASSVYWVEGGPIGGTEGFGRVARVAHDGTGAAILVEAAGRGPFDVDDTHLYFANAFTLKRVSIAGGPVERLAIGDFYVKDVATDGASVYWVEDGLATVRKLPVEGGPVTTLASGSGLAGALRLDATHVYWMEGENTIRRVPKAGGSATTVIGPVPGLLTDFVVAGASAYFSEADGARIRRVPVTGGDAATLVTRLPDQTRRLTTDGASVYWIDQLDLGKVPAAGGSPEFIVLGEIASSPFLANGIAVDATSLYWTEVAANAIKTATPK